MLKNTWLAFRNNYRYNHLGVSQIAKVQWPDGLGSYFTIDKLILRPDGITLLMYKRFPGKIFCADTIDDWTQMLGQKSYKFSNPFYDLDCQVSAVDAFFPNIPVNGFLYFDHTAEFPKGHPERVIHHRKIPETLKPKSRRKVAANVMSAWKKLKKSSRKNHSIEESMQFE